MAAWHMAVTRLQASAGGQYVVSNQNCDSPSPIADGGDSGGPVFVGTRAYGIVKAKGGNFFCAHKVMFSSNTHWQNALDVEIVLAP